VSGLAVLLGLVAAAVYGSSDYAGGIATKRVSVIAVLVVSQTTGLALGLVAVLLDANASASAAALRRGAVAGAVGIIGLGLLYTALARGPMGVVAPVAAVAGAIVPIGYGIVDGERPGAITSAGVLLAVVAVGVTTWHADDPPPGAPATSTAHHRVGVVLGLLSGLCFGAIFVLLSDVDPVQGMWPLVAWRCVSVPVAAIAAITVRPTPRPDRGIVVVAAVAGALEVTGNGVYILAAREGLVSVVGVLGSLAPLSTVLLARVLLRERLSRLQLAALVLALVGITLITLG